MFQDRVAPPFPPAPRTPATTSEFQPPYFPPPFAAHGMLQVLVLVPHSICCIMAASGADSSGGGFLVEHAAAELGRPLPSVLDSTSIPNTASESVFQSNISDCWLDFCRLFRYLRSVVWYQTRWILTIANMTLCPPDVTVRPSCQLVNLNAKQQCLSVDLSGDKWPSPYGHPHSPPLPLAAPRQCRRRRCAASIARRAEGSSCISPLLPCSPPCEQLYMQTHPPTKTLGSTGALLDGLLGGRSSLFRTKMFWRISFEVFFLLNKIFSVSSAFLWQLATRGIHKVSLFENSLLLVLFSVKILAWHFLPQVGLWCTITGSQSFPTSRGKVLNIMYVIVSWESSKLKAYFCLQGQLWDCWLYMFVFLILDHERFTRDRFWIEFPIFPQQLFTSFDAFGG